MAAPPPAHPPALGPGDAATLLAAAQAARAQGQHRDGAALAARAAHAAQSAGQVALAAEAQHLQALHLVRLGDLDGAVASAQAALAQPAPPGAWAGPSLAHSTLSLAYERAGLQALAVSHAATALDLALEAGDLQAECQALIRLGCTDDGSGQRRDLALLEQAVQLARALPGDDPNALFSALNNLSRRWVVDADRQPAGSPAAQAALHQALAHAQEAARCAANGPGHAFMVATVGANLGGIHQRLAQAGQARACRQQALAQAQAGGFAGLARTLQLALAHQALVDTPGPAARAALSTLLDSPGAPADPTLSLQARRALVDSLRDSGETAAALQQLERLHQALHDQLSQRADLQTRLSFHHAELQHSRQAAERAQLAADNERLRADAAQQASLHLALDRDRLAAEVARRTQALQRAQATAEAASRAKSTFLSIVSHELRTPLHGVIGLVDLAQRRAQDTPLAEQLARAGQAARQLGNLVDSILRYVAADTPPPQPPPLVDLHAVLDQLRLAAQARGHTLLVGVTSQVPQRLRVDGERLGQILAALVDNAAKFSTRQPVHLAASWRPSGSGHWAGPAQLRITVTDTGPGVPEALRPRLFQPFEPGDSSPSRSHGGLGLGLALAQRLAHSLGGEVGLEPSSGPSSRFWVQLPVLPAEGDSQTPDGSSVG